MVILPNQEKLVAFALLGDGAFAFHKHLMKPFPGNHEREDVINNNKCL